MKSELPTMRKWLILAFIVLITPLSVKLVSAQGLLYTVTSTGDGGLVGSNTICDDGTGQCTLRAALEASNSHVGIDGIDFAIPTSDPGFDPGTGIWTINLTKALPDISAEAGINGPGADVLIVRRDTGSYRIFKVITTGVVAISGMTISNGNSDGGGGIQNLNAGTLNVTNCALTGNNVFSGNGGGISNDSTGIVNVTNCTLSDNTAIDVGGAMYNFAGTLNVANSTIAHNFGGNPAVGGVGVGGIFNSEGALNVTNCTITANGGGFVGGIFNSNTTGGTANVKSSLIALNTGSSPDVDGTFTSSGFNLIGSTSGSTGFNQPTDLVGIVDPKLDAGGLKDNGGPTQTIALLFGSPAIDKGTSLGLFGILSTDQRGSSFPRTFDNLAIFDATGGDGTDIGAFEVQTATPTPSPTPTPTPTTLGNISTRLRVETGDNVLIGGFIITGTQSKKVLLRAIGPSLPLTGVLTDPSLELHDGSGTLLTSNDNWKDAPNQQEIIDSTIPPPNDLESAILMSLDPGPYTAIVSGVGNTTGIGLVEAYDLESTADSVLANISTRGLVQTGDNVMIGGFIILGTDPREVLLRAIGPSLPLAGSLADPVLELHDGNGTLLTSNDNWRDTQEVEIAATTIPPSDDAESAILQTLAPAAYTAVVRGVNNTTGVALVEVYALTP